MEKQKQKATEEDRTRYSYKINLQSMKKYKTLQSGKKG
jgi:hypothetical protein